MLAYRVDTLGGVTTLRIYDPNWPDHDDISVSIEPTAMRQSTGEKLFGVLSLG